MDKQTQGIQKVNRDQVPVPFEIDQHSAVFSAVIREKLVDFRRLQHRDQEEPDGQRQQRQQRRRRPLPQRRHQVRTPRLKANHKLKPPKQPSHRLSRIPRNVSQHAMAMVLSTSAMVLIVEI